MTIFNDIKLKFHAYLHEVYIQLSSKYEEDWPWFRWFLAMLAILALALAQTKPKKPKEAGHGKD
jgi:hypothetical protein